jgi:hypothetical protein
VPEELLGPRSAVDPAALAADLRSVNLSAELAPALAQEIKNYADRLRMEQENERRLDKIAAPRIELPDLTPPVEISELHQLARAFCADSGA